MYNPLDYHNLTVNLVRELIEPRASDAPPAKPIRGRWRVCPLLLRRRLTPIPVMFPRLSRPIYVGRGGPPGARKGQRSDGSVRQPLYARLREHGRSISAASNLSSDELSVPLSGRHAALDHHGRTLPHRTLSACLECFLDGFGDRPLAVGAARGDLLVGRHAPGQTVGASARQTRTVADAIAKLEAFLRLRPEEAAAEARQVAAAAATEVESA